MKDVFKKCFEQSKKISNDQELKCCLVPYILFVNRVILYKF